MDFRYKNDSFRMIEVYTIKDNINKFELFLKIFPNHVNDSIMLEKYLDTVELKKNYKLNVDKILEVYEKKNFHFKEKLIKEKIQSKQQNITSDIIDQNNYISSSEDEE